MDLFCLSQPDEEKINYYDKPIWRIVESTYDFMYIIASEI